ncbi:type II toxin-antitoxin system HicA family toxin [Peribacillus frigoritolerans]|uniref:type II toxin-antitoxin system HicA family toxin n=1 Tax=Peribacillus frigoritolerans TaxID=450367 RepID=UPI00207A33E2|nr:type II toxin-antitoxin system HicA family toxin [Peribacillus frigoritolerans]USK82113.1 type II toxin-antitoxin system HicA family toxin [Peribacillus frigoritolerans]WJE49406.1 type II toxin-antitoxin system HicA family toxin [Peribacillus frigoritolerans]
MKSDSSRIINSEAELLADGWYLVHTLGGHHYYKHSKKSGRLTVLHPEKVSTMKTMKSIGKQAGIKI